MFDSSGEEIFIFPGMRRVFEHLINVEHLNDVKIGVASRTFYANYAAECLDLLEVDGKSLKEIIHYEEIYPGTKTTHFKSLLQKSGVPFEDMIFFDNERRNCVDVAKLGVTTVHTPNGMTIDAWHDGLLKHAKKKKRATE